MPESEGRECGECGERLVSVRGLASRIWVCPQCRVARFFQPDAAEE